jgi:hypothetical protein
MIGIALSADSTLFSKKAAVKKSDDPKTSRKEDVNLEEVMR